MLYVQVFLSSCKQLLKVVLELRAHLKMETTEVVGQIVEVTRQLVTNLFSRYGNLVLESH